MGVARVRVENKDPGSVAGHKKMMMAFRKARSEAGIQKAMRQAEHYESKGQKRRRKRREAANALERAKLNENFPKDK